MSSYLSYQSLHCHTTTSDGILSYEQVLDECQKNNIGVVAYTDHDALPNRKQIEQLKKFPHEVKWITGIEISAKKVKEINNNIELFHITGLFVDPTNKVLKNYCLHAYEKRKKRTQEMIDKLCDLGFELTYADVEKLATGQSIGRPHIAKALLEKKNNIEILHTIAMQLYEEAKNNTTLQGFAEQVKIGSQWQKLFDLLLSNKSYIKGVYIHYLDGLDLDKAVDLIRGAGGVALLAHWSYMKKDLPITVIEKFLKENRLDGLETVYGFGVDEKNYNSFVTDMKDVTKLCEKYEKIQGGGGDFHTREDFMYMKNKKFNSFAQRTKGMIERIFRLHPDLDKTWTTLENQI